MVEGFIPDLTYGAISQTRWHPGAPEDARFLGMETGSVKYNRDEVMPITAYRCAECGLLKFYARGESE